MTGPRAGVLCAGSVVVDVGKVIDAYPALDHLATIEQVSRQHRRAGAEHGRRPAPARRDVPARHARRRRRRPARRVRAGRVRAAGDRHGGRRSGCPAWPRRSRTRWSSGTAGGARSSTTYGANALFDAVRAPISPSSGADPARRRAGPAPAHGHARRTAATAGRRCCGGPRRRGCTRTWSWSAVARSGMAEVVAALPAARGQHRDQRAGGGRADRHRRAGAGGRRARSTGRRWRRWRGGLVELGVARAGRRALPGRLRRRRAGRADLAPGLGPAAARAEMRSTTGAGDAFAAGVIFGLHEGWPVERCLRLGAAVGRGLRARPEHLRRHPARGRLPRRGGAGRLPLHPCLTLSAAPPRSRQAAAASAPSVNVLTDRCCSVLIESCCFEGEEPQINQQPSAESATPIVVLKDASKSYGAVQALREGDLSLGPARSAR